MMDGTRSVDSAAFIRFYYIDDGGGINSIGRIAVAVSLLPFRRISKKREHFLCFRSPAQRQRYTMKPFCSNIPANLGSFPSFSVVLTRGNQECQREAVRILKRQELF